MTQGGLQSGIHLGGLHENIYNVNERIPGTVLVFIPSKGQ